MKAMTKSLIVFADDLTGTLDTAVQFAMRGIDVISFPTVASFEENSDWSHQVYVLNTNSRHLAKEDAYQTLYTLALAVKSRGCRFIFKKTDSALRGNIGAEICGVMAAYRSSRMVFAPSYPDMERYTKEGIHYYKDTPISESVFGRDPFDPVRYSSVAQIIEQTGEVRVVNLPAGAAIDTPSVPTVFVVDAQTNDDLRTAYGMAKGLGKPFLMAGCAGLAMALAEELEGKAKVGRCIPKIDAVLVVSGSMNQITMQQVSYLSIADYPVRLLYSNVELSAEFLDSPACDSLTDDVCAELEKKHVAILATAGGRKDGVETVDDSDREAIAWAIAMIAKKILDRKKDCALVVLGGDTLLSVVSTLFSGSLFPVGEIMPGVPLSLAHYKDGSDCLIATRSGGFGQDNAVETIIGYFKRKEAEIWTVQ